MRLHPFPALLVLGLAGRAAAPGPLPAQQPAVAAMAALPGDSTDSVAVERLLDSLPLTDKVAQLVMPWVAGAYAAFDDSAFAVAQRWVDSLRVGGVIVSVGSPLDVAMKLNRLQRRSPLPLLIASDLEGGAAFRLLGGTPFPTNMGVAATGREADAYTVGRITALEGRAVGIHLTFAPVADVNSNPDNPIINTRSFGENPYDVARYVAATIKGIQDWGMLATAKHFPGHGDTEVDSHLAVPVITAPWRRLDTLEMVPFRSAVNAGVAFVMSGHIAVPAITHDGNHPATLERSVLTGLLRDSLGFQGMVVTDALDMAGVTNSYGPGEAAVRAFLAGSDLLLMPSNPGQAITAMRDAVESGRITYERLDRSVRRLLQVKRRLGLFRRRTVPLDSVPDIVGNARFLEQARAIATRAVVLVRDSLGAVDSLRARPRRIALITYGDDNLLSVGGTLLKELRQAGHDVTPFRLWPASGPASLDSVRTLTRRNRYTIFAAAVKVNTAKGTIGLPENIAHFVEHLSRYRRLVVVSLGSPYVGLQIPRARSYLIAWTNNPVSEWAAARALSGLAPITGHLPVRLPPHYGVGFGLTRGVPASP